MGKTNIEYADEVSNPLFARPKDDESVKVGTFCEKPDKDGTCLNCWAETLNLRFGNKLTFDKSNRDKIEWVFRGKEMERLVKLNLKKPMSEKFAGLPLVVFCCDTFDIFQPSISDFNRDVIFDIYDSLTDLILLIQTTYPAKMNHYFIKRYPNGLPKHYWLGMSVGTQKWFENNVEYLMDIPAYRRYIIFEPLLEMVDMRGRYWWKDKLGKFIDLVIIGGESGGASRPSHIDNIRFLVKQCRQLGIAPFVKQLGSYAMADNDNGFEGDTKTSFPMDTRTEDWFGDPTKHYQGAPIRVYLKNRKGGELSEFPEDLRIREFPTI
jgi:protein gp37